MRTHTRLRRAVSTGAVAVVGLLLVPTSAWAAESGAEITISKSRVTVGDQIQVVGKNFEPNASVSVQVCGAPDKLGRLACGPGAPNVTVAADGSVNQTLAVNEPAGPCPCSVVIDAADAAPVGARIDLIGFKMAKVAKAPEIVVDKAEIESPSGLGHLFGLAPEPKLSLTLRNAGVSPASPTLNLSWRDGDEESSPIIDPGVPVIEPGQTVEFSVPLKYGALAQGTHSVSGQVVVGDLYAQVDASGTVAPWGLYALAALALGGGAFLRIRKVGAPDEAPVRTRVAAPSRVASAPSRRSSSAATPVPAPRRAARTPDPEPEPDFEPLPPPVPVAAGPMVGPPRLDATPLAPLPGRSASSQPTLQTQHDQGDALLSPWTPTETLLAPSVPHQGSRPWVADPAPSESPAPQAAVPQASTQAMNTLNVPPRHTTPEQDAARVAEAMAAIKERSATAPAQLPDRHEPAPQTGRRAERGGKRAARPEKGQGWITRR